MNPLYDQLLGKHEGKETPFLVLEDDTVVTHGEFVSSASRFANVLTWMGLSPGDRLAVYVEKSPHALALYAACVQVGVVFMPLNTAYTVDELTYFITDSGAKAVVCGGEGAARLSPMADQLGVRLETLNPDGSGSLSAKAAEMSEVFATVERSENDLAALLYTSGTTGRSKGAMLSQGNLLSNALVLAKTWRFDANDVLLHALPIFHTHGLFVATNITLIAGGSMIFMSRFDLDQMIERPAECHDHDGCSDLLHPPSRHTATHGGVDTSHAVVHLGKRATAGRDSSSIRTTYRSSHSRTLRSDRDQHEHLEPVRRRPPSRHGRVSSGWCGAQNHRP